MPNRTWLFLFCASLSAQADIRTAGSLLVDINASSLSALNNGDKVTAWTSAGTLGGSFVPAVSGQGPLYSNNVAGVAAVTFAASANSVLTNTAAVPAAITGNGVWSVEAWVNNPALSSSEEVYLTWTRRGAFTNGLMEARFYNNEVAVEHYYSYLYWNGHRPAANQWNHIVSTKDSSNVERLYVNGVRVYQAALSTNLRPGCSFSLGGSPDDAYNWVFLYSGFIAQVRIHGGTLTPDDIANNYRQDRVAFGQTQIPDTVWTGASGTVGAWTDTGNWRYGEVGGNNGVSITNGGFALIDVPIAPLAALTATAGGLILTNAASLSVSNSAVTVGSGTNNAFALSVGEGAFSVLGTPGTLKFGDAAATSTVSVGGDVLPANLYANAEICLGNGTNGAAFVTVKNNGTFAGSNGWMRIGNLQNSLGSLTIENGGSVIFAGGSGVGLGCQAGNGVVTMNGGLFDIGAGLMLAEGNYGTAAFHLNGGRLVTQRVYDNASASSAFYFNGGTLSVRANTGYSASFLQGLTNAFVQAAGAVFDVPAALSVTVAQPLLNDSSSAGGGLTKVGDGTLTLTGTNSFTGNILVGGGALFFRNAAGLIGGYAGTVTLTNHATIGYDAAGGAALLASNMSPASVGSLALFASNTNDVIDCSAVTNLTIVPQTSMTQTVAITTYNHAYVFTCANATYLYAGTITDVSGGAAGSVTFNGGPSGRLVLTNNNSFTGGVQVNGGTLVMQHANALGSGVKNIALKNGATLKLDAAEVSSSFVQDRLTADSQGLILIGPSCSNLSVNVSGYPGLTIGTEEQYLGYSGTITPDDPIYRLGGGGVAYASAYRGLEVSNLTDGASSRSVAVGMSGMVHLMTGNTYSGGTVVTNRGVIYLDSDGLGAVPSAPAVSNLFVNNGVIRCASAVVNLNANRGVAVGSQGATFHVWSTGYMYVLGDLSGAGKVQETDWGTLGFYGTNNTFTGAVDLNNSTPGIVNIGNGSRFSWASSSDITGVNQGGQLVLNTTADKSFASAVKGTLALVKRGNGVLTMAASSSNTFSRGLTVEAGALRLGAEGVIPFGGNAGNVDVRAAGTVDLNGHTLRVNGLNGAGLLTNAMRTAQAVTLGDNNATSLFAGASAPELRFEKIGAGVHTFAGRSAMTSPTITAGTLEIATPGWLQTAVSINTNAVLRFKTANGLLGEFADYAASANNATATGDTNFNTVAAINALFAKQTITLATNSFSAGPTFDFGSTGSNTCVFPDAYLAASKNSFIARWTGRFYAPVAGTYTFASASDDGSMVFIDGQTVVSNNLFQSYTPYSPRTGSVNLTAGSHAIVIAFFEGTGDQGLTVWVTFPGGSLIPLPQNLLDEGSTSTNALTENTLSCAVSGGASTTVVKTGLPTMRVLSDNSSFGGLWNLLEGALWVGNGGTSGVLGGSSVQTATNSTLAFQRSDAITNAAPISGGGVLRQAGTGTLTLTGTNSYTGGTVIDVGTLRVTSPGTLGPGPLVNNGTLVIAASGTVPQSAIVPVTSVSGSGSVVVESGTLLANGVSLGSSMQVETNASVVLSATNTYGNGTVLLDGGHSTLALNYAIPGSDASRWKLNGSAKWITNMTGDAVIQLTQNAGSLAGSANLYERVPTDQPWALTFRYDVPTKSSNLADGMVAFVHADSRGTSALGLSGGSKGYGTNGSSAAISPSCGFAFNLYPSSNYDFAWATNATEVSKIKGLNGVILTNGNVVARMSYDGSNTLSVTLTQGANVYSASRAVNLRTVLTNSPSAYVGFSGGTGGVTAEQWVSGITVWTAALGSSVAIDQSFATTEDAHATLDCMVEALGTACSVGTLTLADGSTLDICTNSAAFPNRAFTVAFSQVILTNGTATINVSSNGTALGSIGLSTLRVGVGSVITITGNIVLTTGTLTVIAPVDFPRGRTLIADLTGATGISAATPFALSGPTDGKVVYSNGKLYISRPKGVLVLLR